VNQNIRLIASDIDGTLLPAGRTAISPAVLEQIRRLGQKGVRFCPASGRQYHSMRTLFAPVADELVYLCENGAVLFEKGNVIGKTGMDWDTAIALSNDILALPNCEVLISGENMSYVVPKKVDMAAFMRSYHGNLTTVLSRPEDVPEEIVKVSAYCAAGTDAISPDLAKTWEVCHPAVAGECWLDFTTADKGTGLAQLCEVLGISPVEVLAFGDNYNDAAMLSLAGTAFLMDTAAPELLRRFPHHCMAVEDVLKTLLA